MNIQQMMQQAKEMQDRLQKQLAEMRVEATAGGGMVTVVMSGTKQLQSIKLDPKAHLGPTIELPTQSQIATRDLDFGSRFGIQVWDSGLGFGIGDPVGI